MLSWFGISIAFGIICVLFIVVVIGYLVWTTKKLEEEINEKWKDVNIGGKKHSRELRSVRAPGQSTMLQLTLGGTVSSTSSIHPTKETWLNIQNSNRGLSSNNGAEKTTMRDLQEMFGETSSEAARTSSSRDEDMRSTSVTVEKPLDSSA